jgi:hypothetical protein
MKSRPSGSRAAFSPITGKRAWAHRRPGGRRPGFPLQFLARLRRSAGFPLQSLARSRPRRLLKHPEEHIRAKEKGKESTGEKFIRTKTTTFAAHRSLTIPDENAAIPRAEAVPRASGRVP